MTSSLWYVHFHQTGLTFFNACAGLCCPLSQDCSNAIILAFLNIAKGMSHEAPQDGDLAKDLLQTVEMPDETLKISPAEALKNIKVSLLVS